MKFSFILLSIASCAVAFVQKYSLRRPFVLEAQNNRINVALTREEGKNGKLKKALLNENELSSSIQVKELPCIAHADGPDLGILADRLKSERWDYVAVTSPEAARVLHTAWDTTVQQNPPPVSAVGKATEQTLKELGIDVTFCPSKATAATLVQELPGSPGYRVLYPASCKARTTLQNGLRERNFEVVRLNTYDTVTATWNADQKVEAESCQIACFASPSAIKGWLKNTNNNNSVLAACIGETSAQACREQGWKEDQIFYPDKPGVEGWVKAVREALSSLRVAHS